MGLLSPSDIVGPSPVTSNGTETTEIEDDASEEISEEVGQVNTVNIDPTQRAEVCLDTFCPPLFAFR